MTEMTSNDPAAIEREIRRTQDNMSSTVDKIGSQLSIKNVVNALLDKADESNIDARMVLDGARRNPVALGLIAAGTIWLVSDKDSKLPSLGDRFGKSKGGPSSNEDVHHRDYVSHMSAVEQRPHEDAMAYQRRRDLARSNFFMLERKHEEDDTSFRERLDGMTEKFRQTRNAWADSAKDAKAFTADSATAAVAKAKNLYSSYPLVGGILAAALGAAFGSSLPITEQEQDKLGTLGDKARDVIDESKDQVASQLREKKDELLGKADAALQPAGDAAPHAGDRPAGGPEHAQAPFMAGR